MSLSNSLAVRTIAMMGINGMQQQLERRRRAAKLFWRMRSGGWLRSLQARLLDRRQELRRLDQDARGSALLARHAIGVRDVPLNLIRGSEGRSRDFDGDFRPLSDEMLDRWIGVAAARLSGKQLPPVELIELGGRYYVRDGHHRISTAKAMGQIAIEANVVVWREARALDGSAGGNG